MLWAFCRDFSQSHCYRAWLLSDPRSDLGSPIALSATATEHGCRLISAVSLHRQLTFSGSQFCYRANQRLRSATEQTMRQWVASAESSSLTLSVQEDWAKRLALSKKIGPSRHRKSCLIDNGAILTENGAYMAPTWASKCSQDAQKIDPKIDHVCWCLLGLISRWVLVYFDPKNGTTLAPKWNQKSMLTWTGDFSKIVLWLQRGLDFS